MDSVNQLTALRGYDHPHVIDDRVTIPHNCDRGRELRPCPACDAVAALQAPIAGHAGDCAKVLQATVTGKTDAACSCWHINA